LEGEAPAEPRQGISTRLGGSLPSTLPATIETQSVTDMAKTVRQAFIGVGANLGDRWATIRGALAALAQTLGILMVESSSVYETARSACWTSRSSSILVAGIETTLTPEQLLMVLHALEDAAGRKRACEIRWGPRVLDLDLLLYEGRSGGPELVLPHPPCGSARFVLVPLRELLSRSMRFRRPAWADLRARLATVNVPVAGVQRWGRRGAVSFSVVAGGVDPAPCRRLGEGRGRPQAYVGKNRGVYSWTRLH